MINFEISKFQYTTAIVFTENPDSERNMSKLMISIVSLIFDKIFCDIIEQFVGR